MHSWDWKERNSQVPKRKRTVSRSWCLINIDPLGWKLTFNAHLKTKDVARERSGFLLKVFTRAWKNVPICGKELKNISSNDPEKLLDPYSLGIGKGWKAHLFKKSKGCVKTREVQCTFHPVSLHDYSLYNHHTASKWGIWHCYWTYVKFYIILSHVDSYNHLCNQDLYLVITTKISLMLPLYSDTHHPPPNHT